MTSDTPAPAPLLVRADAHLRFTCRRSAAVERLPMGGLLLAKTGGRSLLGAAALRASRVYNNLS